ncbi:MAG: deoxyribodipyrimidine photolyase [Pirellulaceae bacterium]
MHQVPEVRIRRLGDSAVNSQGEYVLYWMTSYRRPGFNFSLQRAADWAEKLNRPLMILEALGCDYRWASDRLHSFLIQGMVDNARVLGRKRVLYYPYVEPEADAAKGLLAALARRAAIVVSDDFPCFFLPSMYRAAARQIPVQFELVDSNGLLPMRATDRIFLRAVDFRRFLQKNLGDHLQNMPESDPLAGRRLPRLDQLPEEIHRRWPVADIDRLFRSPACLSELPIDHSVAVSHIAGGARAAEKTLRTFLDRKIARYADDRNQPAVDVTSGLSPYLHAGHIAAHQVFLETTARDGWSLARVAAAANGKVNGWWGASRPVESFLDELITWRELGYNMCHLRADYDQYDSLPQWARQTLYKHIRDSRAFVYSLEQFERAETHDPLWNAAQRQLVREGRIHNYLRMLWGKKVLEWTSHPEEALQILIQLNNKFALDGRDPNSYSGLFWCLGRYDRPWGPERPVLGTVRYMSSANTARKVRVREYLERYADPL